MGEGDRRADRVFEPPMRPTVRLPAAPPRGPVVAPVDWSAGDRAIAAYFWASTEKDGDAWTATDEAVLRVINFGLKAQPVAHGTPFGHGHLTVHVDRLPLAIASQMIRHRVQQLTEDGAPVWMLDWQPNISQKSYRYVKAGGSAPTEADIEDLMYIPDEGELRGQQGRPGEYRYEPLQGKGWLVDRIRAQAEAAWGLYLELTSHGVAPEQARFSLPQALLTKLYVTASYRNWLTWLVQRNDPHAQMELRMVGEQVEAIVAQCIPLTYKLWLSHGRRTM